MTIFELLSDISLENKTISLPTHTLPEIVHLDDPAIEVMVDFSNTRPETISSGANMNYALSEMKSHGTHFMLVKSDEGHIIGLISTEDILGEKPIKLIQQRRVERNQVTVKLLMTPIKDIPAVTIKSVRYAKVGNIVETLTHLKSHYAFVVSNDVGDSLCVCGMLSTWQIGRQLHTDIADKIENAHSISELQKRKKK